MTRRVERFSLPARPALLAAVLWLALVPAVFGQVTGLVDGSALRPGSIEGWVDQRPSGRVLANVLVTVASTLQTARTDVDGRFVLTGVPAGTHVLNLSSTEAMPARIVDVLVKPGQRTTLGTLTLAKGLRADGVYEGEPYVVSASQLLASSLVSMSPFEVRADADHGYGALESNSLTAFRVDLDKLPATTNMFTKTFMDDIAATSIEDMIVAYGGVTGFAPGESLAITAGDEGDRNSGGAGGLSIRGMAIGIGKGSLKRDGFIGPRVGVRSATGSSDNFSTERVEMIAGPQSLLYGGVGGGGVVNLVSKRANFRQRRGSLRYTLDRYGSKRALFDYNFGQEKVAARVAAVVGEARTNRYLLGSDINGLYAQLAFQVLPKTVVRVWGESQVTDAISSFRPNLNAFLPATDPRRNLDARYLVLTGQTRDLAIIDGGLNYGNLESMASWWSSERTRNKFTGLSVESSINRWLSAQVAAVYGDMEDGRILQSLALVPGGAVNNPFNGTAITTLPAVNAQPARTAGFRAMFLAAGRFFGGRANSQTALGLEATHFIGNDSIDYRYYQADANWNVIRDPARLVDYGRTQMPAQAFLVQHGIPRQPLFRPRTARVTVNGVNYVLDQQVYLDPARKGPSNLYGLVLNNGATYAGHWRQDEVHDRAAFLSNFTDWFDGRLTTLAGVRFGLTTSLGEGVNSGPITRSYREPWDESMTGNVGLTYALRSNLRVFASVSSSYNSLSGQTRDLHGNLLGAVEAGTAVPELGVRYTGLEGRVSAQLTMNPETLEKHRQIAVATQTLDIVNPLGINGRYNNGNTWVGVDRRSGSVEFTLTANPTRNWRMRFVASRLDGEIASSAVFPLLYNDQFHTRGTNVTYANGTPLLVDPAGRNGARTTPLTLAMLNTPGSPYYANPDPDSGAIGNSALRAVLSAVDPVNGSAATNAPGQPISSIQYNWSDPNRHGGDLVVFEAGEKTTGMNEYNLNFQSHTTIASGRLKGVGLFVDVRTFYRNRGYYVSTTPPGSRAINATRSLYGLPTATVVGAGLSYSRKIFGRTWQTQLNVGNVFNHYRVLILPQPTSGAYTLARLSATPRQFIWSNTISF